MVANTAKGWHHHGWAFCACLKLSPNPVLSGGVFAVAPIPFISGGVHDAYLGNTMTTPADLRPLSVWELLQEAWAYLRTAVDVGDTAGCAVWLEAFDLLLDRLLAERPDLRAV